MATVNREAIETFMSITGAPEAIAIQRLEEYGGNLNEAVNAHFSEGDRNNVQETRATTVGPPTDFMDIDGPPQMEPHGPPTLLSATRGLDPFSLLDPTFRRSLFDSRTPLFGTGSEHMGREPFVSQPREVREISIEVKDGHDNSAGHSSHGPRIEDVTDTVPVEGQEICGTVIVDDEDDETFPGDLQSNRSTEIISRPSASQFDNKPEYGNDIEEEMIRAAIEASKRDAELQNKQNLHDVGPQERPYQHDDTDLSHVVSLSLKTAEVERLQREQAGASGSRTDKTAEMEDPGKIDESNLRQGVGNPSSSEHTSEAGNLSIQDEFEELDEQPLVRHRSRRRSSGSEVAHSDVGEAEVSPTMSAPPPDVASQSQTHLNGNAFPSDEWREMSSEEHDEAVMLEAAMFGGIPESGYCLPCAPNQLMHSGLDTWRAPRPPSPSLVAQRAIREQQDDEYFASLQADREKELRAVEEEKAAREAALEEQRRKVEESQRKLEEQQICCVSLGWRF